MKLKTFIFQGPEFMETLEIEINENDKVYEILSIINKNNTIEYKKVSISSNNKVLNPEMTLAESGLKDMGECYITFNPNTASCCKII